MSFFFNQVKNSQTTKKSAPKAHIPIATMQQMGCKACPLNTAVGLKHGKMNAYGDENPDVYVLGAMPTESDDDFGRPFSGKDGRTINSAIPRKLSARFHHTIRCHAANKEAPALSETECCRNYIVADIEQSKPKVIVGTGGVPLQWATGLNNVTNWRGKGVAVKIGKHSCWYYPVYSLEFVRQKAGNYGKSEFEQVFDHDWEQIALLTNAAPPVVHTGNYDEGIVIITGNDGRADMHRLEDAFNFLVKIPQAGIDLETNSKLRPYDNDAKIITCAIGNFESTIAFALDHPDGWPEHMRKDVWGLFIDYLVNSNKKIAHHLGFELEWLCHKIDKSLAYSTEWADTMLMSHTLDERKGVNSLDDQCRQHLGFFLKDQSRVDVKRIMEFPLKEVLRYNGMDSKWTDKLYTTLHPIIYGNKKFAAEYERKLRLEPTLVLTQLKGVDVDFDYAKKMQTELDTQLAMVEKKIRATPEVKQYERKFGTFSITSNDEVVKMMDKVLHREEIKKANGGTTSDEAALGRMPVEEVPSAPLILEHRAVSKLLSTYVMPVVTKKIVAPDGKIHTKYNSTIAETGRLSSEDPNLQNFPKRKHKQIRGMVTAGAGWFFPCDYGQLEARVIAWCSEDEALMRSLWTGFDIHGHWTDKLLREYAPVKDRILKEYPVGEGDVDKHIRKMLRDEMKNGWVFPQFFGASTRSCAANLKIPEDIANDMGEEFWGEFTGVKKWQEKIMRFYEKNLYVETLGGRRRRGAMTKNQIINLPVQGTAADLVTDAMCEVTEYATIGEHDDYQPRLNVHDDLTFRFPDEEDEDTMMDELEHVMRIMCKHRFKYINVPVVVEASMGRDWYNQKKLGDYRSDVLFNLQNPFA